MNKDIPYSPGKKIRSEFSQNISELVKYITYLA